MEQPCSTSRVIASSAPAQSISNIDKKLDELSNQVKQIQINSSKCKLVMPWLLMTSPQGHCTLFNAAIGRESKISRLTSNNGR